MKHDVLHSRILEEQRALLSRHKKVEILASYRCLNCGTLAKYSMVISKGDRKPREVQDILPKIDPHECDQGFGVFELAGWVESEQAV